MRNVPKYEIRFVNNLPEVFEISSAKKVDGVVLNIGFPSGVFSTPAGPVNYINGPARGIVMVDDEVFIGVTVVV